MLLEIACRSTRTRWPSAAARRSRSCRRRGWRGIGVRLRGVRAVEPGDRARARGRHHAAGLRPRRRIQRLHPFSPAAGSVKPRYLHLCSNVEVLTLGGFQPGTAVAVKLSLGLANATTAAHRGRGGDDGIQLVCRLPDRDDSRSPWPPSSTGRPASLAWRARAQTTIVLDRHGQPAFTFFSSSGSTSRSTRSRRHMVHALLAVEDRRFYSHYGLDPIRIGGAACAISARGRSSRAAARSRSSSPEPRAVASPHLRAEAARGDARAAAGTALFKGADPPGVSEHRLLRRRVSTASRRHRAATSASRRRAWPRPRPRCWRLSSVPRRAMRQCLGRPGDATAQPGASADGEQGFITADRAQRRDFGRRCRSVHVRVSRCVRRG